MEDAKIVSAVSEPEITIDGFGPEEAKKLKEILTRFLHEYGKKPPEVSDEEWLCQRFQAELPDMSEEEARSISQETVASVKEYDANLASLSATKAQGQTTEEWFADMSREAAAGISAIEFGHRMEELGDVLSEANAQLYRTVTTQSGEISQQFNLDGFLAEQQAVNSFNAAAKLSDSPFRAEVCVPEAGQTYGKNSFDVVIRSEGGQIVHQYQFKYIGIKAPAVHISRKVPEDAAELEIEFVGCTCDNLPINMEKSSAEQPQPPQQSREIPEKLLKDIQCRIARCFFAERTVDICSLHAKFLD